MHDTPAPAIATPTSQLCPQCGATLPVNSGFVTWCDQCAWNLKPHQTEQPRTVFDSIYLSLNKRFSARLRDQVLHTPLLRPTLTPALGLAYGVALAIHSLTLLTALVGITLIVQGWGYWIIVALGAILLLIAWEVCPRMPRFKEADEAVTRQDFPTLFRVVDELAATLHSPPVDTIVLDSRFNAAFGRYGWCGQRVLYLGLPLFGILNAQEKVALLGHELAHGVNGDPVRGLFIGSAINTLDRLYRLLRPTQIVNRQTRAVRRASAGWGIAAISAMLSNVLMLALTHLLRLVIRGVLLLVWHTSQRAEYLADALGAQVGGTEANLGLLTKLHMDETVDLVTHRVALIGAKADLMATLRGQVAAMPAREVERIRRVERMDGSHLDTHHPPTGYRVDLLQAQPVTQPRYMLAEVDALALDRELATVQARVQADLIDQHNSRLYR